MPYTIRTKDGITLNNIPDDVAPDSDELKQRVAQIRAGGGSAPRQPTGFEPGGEKERAFAAGMDPTNTRPGDAIGGFFDNLYTGIGKGATDIGLAARQLAATAGLGDKEALSREAAEKKRIDAPLMNTGGGMVGSVVPDLALAFAPLGGAKFLPQIARAMGSGALSGVLAPEENYNPVTQAGTGAAFGAGGDIAGRAVGLAAKPFRRSSATAQENAAILGEAGLPSPLLNTQTDSPLVRNLSNALEQIPIAGQPLIKSREKNLEWITRLASEDTGKVVSEMTPSAREAFKREANARGNAFRTGEVVDLAQGRAEIQAAIDKVEEYARATNQAAKLKPLAAARDAVTPPAGEMQKEMTTDRLMDLRAAAGKLAWKEKDPHLREQYAAVKRYYEDAIRSVQPDGGAAFDKWLKEWGATKDLLTAERKGTEGGRLSPRALASTMLPKDVMQPFTREQQVFAAAAENIPEKMGGWNRALYTAALLGAPTSLGIGAGLTSGDFGAGTAAGLGTAGVLWNALARKPISPETLELLRKAIASGTIAAGN